MAAVPAVLTVADVRFGQLGKLLARFGLSLTLLDDGAEITGSYWSAPEAGVVGRTVYVRLDTPIHSVLHESCHVVCMDERRREGLYRDAGGDDLEEAAVCYLQVLLADHVPGVGRDRLMRDMDAWGYSFRLGSARAWFESDADDAGAWLRHHGLVSAAGSPAFRLRVDIKSREIKHLP